jgi:hypothetical protein
VAQRSKITRLPGEVRDWLNATLAENNFSGYEQLECELRERGFTIGKSSIHRYGANLERKLSAIKASTEAARLIAQGAPDDADQRSAAVIAMIQTEVFEVLVALQEADAASDPMARAKLLSTVAKNVATLSRASVAQKKHEIAIRAKTQATADRVASLAKKGGLSAPTVETIKREILGIAA